MPTSLPALNLIATPGRRRATLDIAREIEARGFPQIQISSSFSNMSQCVGLALGTERITFATAIAPIYAATVDDFAQSAAYIHEVPGGRFQFGIGIAHGAEPCPHGRDAGQAARRHPRLRRQVQGARRDRRAAADHPGDVAQADDRARRRDRRRHGVRQRQPVAHGGIARGAPAEKRNDPNFFIGNRIRTCISDDVDEAKAVLRRIDDELRVDAQLPQLLEGSRLRRGDDRDREGRRRGPHAEIAADT